MTLGVWISDNHSLFILFFDLKQVHTVVHELHEVTIIRELLHVQLSLLTCQLGRVLSAAGGIGD